MKKFISYIAFLGLASSFMLIDSSLDPGRILWPTETWVSSPIQLSQTNAGSIVKLTFTLRPSTTLANGVLEVIYPSSILGGPIYIPSSFSGDKDVSLTYTSITLPASVGIYGPFVLITRSSQTGQMYDLNNVFGYIAITSTISTSSDLTVTNESVNPMIGSSDTLYFAFSLNQNLWKYDLIEIIPSDSYMPSSLVTCSSITVAGIPNILYGPTGDHNLPCAIATQSSSTTGPQYTISESNSVYIYGLSQDIILASGSITIKLSISTFNYPLYKRQSASNTWKINIWRWGTSNLIAQYVASSGPTTPIEGTITAAWSPINDALSASDVIGGMVIFTKVTFTTHHDIPAAGTAIITFWSIDISLDWWEDLDGSNNSGSQCYLTIPINGASCAISSINIVTITFANKMPAGSVSIALLTAFNQDTRISEIVTTDSSSNYIDYVSNPISWPINTNNLLYSFFKFHGYSSAIYDSYPRLADSGTYLPGLIYGADTSLDLYWTFTPSSWVTWTTSTYIAIYLPFTTSGVSFTQPYISETAIKYEMNNDLTLNNGVNFYSPPTKATFSLSQNTIYLNFQLAPTLRYYTIAVGNGESALPYVASNLGTFYECFAISLTGSKKEIGNSVYSVIIKDYLGADIYARPFCNANWASGIPLVSVFAAKIIAIDFTSAEQNFVLEIKVTNGADLNTGLAKGSYLPLSSTVPGTTAVLDETIGDTIIKLTGLGVVIAGRPAINTFLAMGKLADTSFIATSRLYYITAKDPSIKNYLYQSTQSPITLTNSQNNPLVSGTYVLGAWTPSSNTNYEIGSARVAIEVSSPYIGIGLPTGFKLSPSSIISINGNVASTIYSASNSNDYTSGGFIIGYSTNPNYRITTSGVTITITEVTAPGYSGESSSSNSVLFNIFGASSFGGSCDICGTDYSFNFVYPGEIANSLVTCTLSSYSAADYDSVDATMTITVTTVHRVPENGIISLTLALDWAFYLSTCTVIGPSDIDSNNKVICSISSHVLTIGSFAVFEPGTITITILHVRNPLSGGIYTCVSQVATQDARLNYIDYGSALFQEIIITVASAPVSLI